MMLKGSLCFPDCRKCLNCSDGTTLMCCFAVEERLNWEAIGARGKPSYDYFHCPGQYMKSTNTSTSNKVTCSDYEPNFSYLVGFPPADLHPFTCSFYVNICPAILLS